MVTDVSEERVTFIFREKQSKKTGYLILKTAVLETSVTVYQSTRCNIQGDVTSLYCCDNHRSGSCVRLFDLYV